ncbi:MAG: hypothetical protein JST82_14690 [Bacteroidetes bacterium]|nr:hypothetical protein [Bacteroidota bacterium]
MKKYSEIKSQAKAKTILFNGFFASLMLLISLWCCGANILWGIGRTAYYELNTTNLTERDTIYIPNSDIASLNEINNNEYTYRGKMFDVKTRMTTDSGVVLIGEYDDFDDKFFDVYSRLLSSNNQRDCQDNLMVFKILSETALCEPFELSCNFLSDSNTPFSSFIRNGYRSNITFSIFQPPRS